MAASLQKLLKKTFPSSPLRFLTSLNSTTTTTQTNPSPFPFILSDQPHHLPFLNPSDPNSLFHHIHPNQASNTILNYEYFPNTFLSSGCYGNGLSSILNNEFVLNHVLKNRCVLNLCNGNEGFEEEVGEEESTVKCDSVKKKRKRKMNKHKYKKMRKALRKKTG